MSINHHLFYFGRSLYTTFEINSTVPIQKVLNKNTHKHHTFICTRNCHNKNVELTGKSFKLKYYEYTSYNTDELLLHLVIFTILLFFKFNVNNV